MILTFIAMSHRLYLYNIDSQTGDIYSSNLTEWNYIIPILFQPLFCANPRSKGKKLFFDQAEGVRLLKDFYALLADTYQLQSQADFQKRSRQVFSLLENLPYDSFYLDATDVFNMSEEPHTKQAKEWLLEIQEKNRLFVSAISNQNISLLEPLLKAEGYESFLDVLQDEYIDYGWGLLEAKYHPAPQALIFEEHNQFGLKDAFSNIIVAAAYDHIYAASYDGYMVVEKDHKFGYLFSDGQLIVPLIYDDAFDVHMIQGSAYGIVKQGRSFGLVELLSHSIQIPIIYESLEFLAHDVLQGKITGNYKLLAVSNQVLADEESDRPFEYHSQELFCLQQAGMQVPLVYSILGKKIGAYLPDNVIYIHKDYYLIKPYQKAAKQSIIRAGTGMIISDIEQFLYQDSYQSFAFKKGKKVGLYDMSQHELIEEPIFDQVYLDHPDGTTVDLFRITKGQEKGLYHALKRRWILPLSTDYSRISYLCYDTYIYQKAEGMYYYRAYSDIHKGSFEYISEPIESADLLMYYERNQLFIVDHNNTVSPISPEKLVYDYERRFQLGQQDLEVFTDYFNHWKENSGDAYIQYLEIDHIRKMADDWVEEELYLQAVNLLELAVKRSDASADLYFDLAYLYAEQPEVIDYTKAIYYYQKAAESMHPYALNNLGHLAKNGLGMDIDIALAISYFKQAVQTGNGFSAKNLGNMYYDAQGVDQDLHQALFYYQQAQEMGEAVETEIISTYFQLEDFKQVLNLLQEDQQESYSSIFYGIMYADGIELEQNDQQAIYYYESALNYELYPTAINQLLHYYKEGAYASEQDYKRILHLAEIAESAE